MARRYNNPVPYNKSRVKVANERLRKLETVSHLAPQSSAYRSIEKFAMNKNSPDNKFYRWVTNKDGTPGIRFLTPSQYASLSKDEMIEFNKTLDQFLDNMTSTKLGVEKAKKKSYDNFMENHPNLNWTQDEYEKFWKKYSDYLSDQEERERYNRLTQILDYPDTFDFTSDLTDEKIDEVLHYTNREYRYSEAPKKTTRINNRRIRE